MKICQYCGSQVEDAVTACPNCSANAFSHKCDFCGQIVDEGKFCSNCGLRLDETVSDKTDLTDLKKDGEEGKPASGHVFKIVIIFMIVIAAIIALSFIGQMVFTFGFFDSVFRSMFR